MTIFESRSSQWIFAVMAVLPALLFVSCASSGPAPRQTRNDRLPAGTRILLGEISDISGQPDALHRKERLKTACQKALAQAGLLASTTAPHVYTLKVEISQFAKAPLPKNNGIRHIQVQAYLHDSQGNPIGKISAERGFTSGNGLPIGLGEQVYDQLGEDIAADIRAHTQKP